MNPAASPLGFLQEIETRQDDLLRRLDELERRIVTVLLEHSPRSAADDLGAASPSVVAPATGDRPTQVERLVRRPALL
ncbi:MAG TPA: hypothetical protein VMV69_23040 [Pirellulales bacterium]|nr:hypothetical protein [Pirellulales bacterium]